MSKISIVESRSVDDEDLLELGEIRNDENEIETEQYGAIYRGGSDDDEDLRSKCKKCQAVIPGSYKDYDQLCKKCEKKDPEILAMRQKRQAEEEAHRSEKGTILEGIEKPESRKAINENIQAEQRRGLKKGTLISIFTGHSEATNGSSKAARGMAGNTIKRKHSVYRKSKTRTGSSRSRTSSKRISNKTPKEEIQHKRANIRCFKNSFLIYYGNTGA